MSAPGKNGGRASDGFAGSRDGPGWGSARDAGPTRLGLDLTREPTGIEGDMNRPKRWTAPRATLLGWLILGAATAGASEISASRPGTSTPDAALGTGSAPARPDDRPAVLGDLRTLGRSVAGLDPRRTLLDHLAAPSASGAWLLPDDLRRPVPPSPWPTGLDLPIIGGLDGEEVARGPDLHDHGAGQPTAARNVPHSPIPEPASIILLATGLVGLWIRGRMRRNLGR